MHLTKGVGNKIKTTKDIAGDEKHYFTFNDIFYFLNGKNRVYICKYLWE